MPLHVDEPKTFATRQVPTQSDFAEVAMIARAAPLAVCLLWLAYESHFSPSFFLSTAGHGLASLVGGLEDVMLSDRPDVAKDTAAETVRTASAQQ
jgi:hypothetical protein